MPSTRDLRRRIKSVKNTSQITKAMQMVAASKMRKAQQAALAGRPYAELMSSVLAEVTANAGDYSHPLMKVRELKKRAVILISTDKGLCGSLNSNLMREAAKHGPLTTLFIAVGRKGAQFLARTRRPLSAEFTYKDVPQFSEARAVAKYVIDLFIKEEIDQVEVLYTKFISTLTQKPETRLLLPVGANQLNAGGKRAPTIGEIPMKGATEFLFEPSAAHVFESLLPHYLNYELFQMMLEAKASEHSSRMVAMKNATDNAKQLIKDLTLEYNKLRQASITKEILEISTAAMAM